MKRIFKDINEWIKTNVPMVHENFLFVYFQTWLLTFVEVASSQKAAKKNESDATFRKEEENTQGKQGNQRVGDQRAAQNGQPGVRVPEASADKKRTTPNQSERVFAAMIANNFKFPEGYKMADIPEDMDLNLDPHEGPTVEDVDSSDLD